MSKTFTIDEVLDGTFNAEPAIALLTEHAAKAVFTSIKAEHPLDRVCAGDNVYRYATALSGLGVTPDDVVDSICQKVDQGSTVMDDDPPFMPRGHELVRYVRGVLADAESDKRADRVAVANIHDLMRSCVD